MEFLQTLLENYNIPILSAFILGLMTSISPCPLATNITATAFISKNIASIALHKSCGFRLIGTREKIGQHKGIWYDNNIFERRSKKVGL